MADDLTAVRAELARRHVHFTRRQLLRGLTATGLGLGGLARLLSGDGEALYPTLRALLAVQPVYADDDDEDQHGEPLRGSDLPATNRTAEGRFGFMFKDLPPYAPPDTLLSALAGLMIEPVEPDDVDVRHDNLTIPSGFTFLGQFIDHDLTFDTTPLTDRQSDPNAVTNFRSARYDLDSMYGRGPALDMQYYDPADRDMFLIAGLRDPAVPDDLPRDASGKATIADSRNDENMIVAQLTLAMMKFHNAIVAHLRRLGTPAVLVFPTARQLTRWHFQWVVARDFLPRIIGQPLVDQLLAAARSSGDDDDDDDDDDGGTSSGMRFYRPADRTRPMMPVEFAVAAFRFGHSMVRPRYTINGTGRKPIFGATPTDDNLNGGRPITPPLVVDWSNLFNLDPAKTPRPSRRINSQLAPPLFDLPLSVVPATADPLTRFRALAERNLLRGKRLGLPSGQRVARRIGAPSLTNQQLGLSADPGWGGQAPLWFYILKEAELQQRGERLGAVGGRLVGEVLVGLLKLDRTSYLSLAPGFRPLPPIAPAPGQFAMTDLLRFAGVT